VTSVSIPLNDTGRPRVETGTDPEVRLLIPATSRYLRLARLTAAGLAGDLGYSVDAIEDLRIAVDELCAAIIEDTPSPAQLELSYRESEGKLVVEGTCRARSTKAPDLHSVARELLNMLADEYSIGAIDGHRNFRLVKYAERPQG
jgi:serine/threonine-protein kinase RsbW